MKIQILQVGRTKQEGIQEFLKRLRPFVTLEIIDLKEKAVTKAFSKEKAIEEEGQEILKKLDSKNFTIVLDEKGKEFTSVEFSSLLKNHKDSGQTITFIIGGAYGLSEKVKQKANLLLSLSKMTFTHQMVRLFLLEQMYRGICIIQGKEYHNP